MEKGNHKAKETEREKDTMTRRCRVTEGKSNLETEIWSHKRNREIVGTETRREGVREM